MRLLMQSKPKQIQLKKEVKEMFVMSNKKIE